MKRESGVVEDGEMTTMGGKHKSVFCRKIGNLTISIISVINHVHIHLSKNVGFRRDIFF